MATASACSTSCAVANLNPPMRVWQLLGARCSCGTSRWIQNNCEFWRFLSSLQAHAFSNANPRKPVFPRIDPADCKTESGRAPV
jgi:hypothetical protein